MMRRRTTKADRCAENANRCEILGGLGGGALAAIGGGLAGLLGGGGDREQTRVPRWSPEQLPYLFGDRIQTPAMPQYRADALNYARGLSAGYNPAFGPQGAGALAGPAVQGGVGPYYLDPQARARYGGLPGLLGFGQGGPPPLFTNSPYMGTNVDDPSRLQLSPGMTRDDLAPAPALGPGVAGPAQGELVKGPGGGLAWGVRVGDGLLSLPEAMPMVRAGLLSIETGGGPSIDQARTLQASEDAMGYG